MLPSGLIAAALLLSLIPGWWFLRRTEACRRPRQLSSLQEVLELVGVGVLTSGVAVGVGLLVRPQLVLDHKFPPNTPGEIRLDVALVLGALLAATGVAEVAARVLRWATKSDESDKSDMNIGPWWSVMRREAIPAGKLAYMSIALADGSTVDGVLHNYTWSPESAHRDIALLAPIKFTRPSTDPSGKPVVVQTPYNFLLVPESEIRHIALKYANRTN